MTTPNFEDKTGLSQSESTEFARFQRDLAPYFAAINNIDVKILIWGPGKDTHYYPKRVTIKEHLQAQHPRNEIATSEDLLKGITHPSDIAIVQAEMLHATVADVIFGLVTSDPKQTGIYMEIDNILQSDALVNKTWIIIPDSRDWKKVGSFIKLPLLQSFPGFRTKPFRTSVLEKCEQLRQFCSEKVSEARGRKVRHYIQQVLHDL